jgi:hypothetical protein
MERVYRTILARSSRRYKSDQLVNSTNYNVNRLLKTIWLCGKYEIWGNLTARVGFYCEMQNDYLQAPEIRTDFSTGSAAARPGWGRWQPFEGGGSRAVHRRRLARCGPAPAVRWLGTNRLQAVIPERLYVRSPLASLTG